MKIKKTRTARRERNSPPQDVFSHLEVEIKKLDEDHWQDYRNLRLEALQGASVAFGSSYEEEMTLSEADWKKRIPNALFAFADGKPVGLIVFVFNRRAKTRHIVDIFSFYVKTAYRRKGIGQMLLETALAETKAQKHVIKIRLSVNPEQKDAVRLYSKFGFKTVGCLEKELLVDGRFYDELVMEKYL